eukprot:CAMPEP_0176485872 /NCGR_PEP_ID=MMETSP0200_2-20121128/5271_1 /TAXON_ID=947934 /ORGANISM="Chaetoceros sp., Strain GSL56" /LENGTH=515 /DNA_ID=CAMNT_0017882545 /DNA_START=26 /DNA_END=1573 /DNA_ORIENTATION=-
MRIKTNNKQKRKCPKILFTILISFILSMVVVTILVLLLLLNNNSAGGNAINASMIASLLLPDDNHHLTPMDDNNNNNNNNNKNRPPDCTLNQLKKVRRQLRPDTCFEAIEAPFYQTCSFTQETKCPDVTNYLDEYYQELQQEYLEKTIATTGNGDKDIDTDIDTATYDIMEAFVGLSVGCNKGFDALNTLRRGTFDASLSKHDWGMEMTKDGILHQSVCAQNVTLSFQVLPNIVQPRKGTVHCFEPVPATVKKLQTANRNLGYEAKGYKVIHAAVSNVTGVDYFQSKSRPGHENGGLGNCRNDVRNVECDVQVQVLTLADYVKEHFGGNDSSSIHILQIDVEGYDADVLLGAGKDVLERVEYLEFEYNWMGSWKNQHLYDVIEMLDDVDFTCYWAGNQKLWRLTGCWQLYFDVHAWSNVACVNRKRVPRLAMKMENIFQQLLLMEDGGTSATTITKGKMMRASRHEIMSLDPTMMTSKYLSPEAISRAMVKRNKKIRIKAAAVAAAAAVAKKKKE